MVTEQDYAKLAERLSVLQQKKAVLEAREKDKAKERDELEVQLRQAGVDICNPEQEIARLEQEIEEDYRQLKMKVDTFEQELNKAFGS